MNVINALNARCSVRAFSPKPVDKETLQKVLEAANRAPSWADTQPWEVFVAAGEPLNRLRAAALERFEQGVPVSPDLARPQSWPPALLHRLEENSAHRNAIIAAGTTDPDVKKAVGRLNREFFHAPAVICLCMDRALTPWSIFDLGMMAQSVMLAATELGLGTVTAVNLVGYPDLIRQELSIPQDLTILIGIAIGYADENHVANKPRSLRRPLEEVVRFVGI